MILAWADPFKSIYHSNPHYQCRVTIYGKTVMPYHTAVPIVVVIMVIHNTMGDCTKGGVSLAWMAQDEPFVFILLANRPIRFFMH